ncbi:MAG: alpha/beta fold hydrolase [Caldilineales bacterium]|nr:alpha/beta fold hydrolase [Caldilineales bacterium]MDW8318289.1 alpha/beta fold hydrolase [Anaerolineae bacterium]
MKRKLRGLKRTDLQLDFDLYRVRVPIPGLAGDELSVIDISPPGAARAILFVHGFAGCAETWQHQIVHFSREYRVVAPDLRGHGQSDAPYTRYTMDELVGDLEAIVRHLALPQPFVLVGHSFGGAICVEYAAAHPERLERLVLIATAGEYPLPKAASLAARLPTALVRPLWDYRPAWNAEVHVLKRMAVNNMMQWQGWTLLRRLRTPTLVITGERDTYFPRYVYEDVARMIPGAQVVDIGVSKHKVQLERHQAVNRAIERFIEQDERRVSWREPSAPASPLAQRPWLKAYGREVPATVPIPQQPLHSFLESAAEWIPRRAATVFFGGTLSYGQLNRQANQLAHVLHGMGLHPGDRAMILLPNAPELVVAFFGVLKLGGVAVFPSLGADVLRLAEQARLTGAQALITLRELEGSAQAVQAQSGVREVILADLRGSAPAGLVERWLEGWGLPPAPPPRAEDDRAAGRLMGALLRDAPPTYPDQAVDPQQPAAILFTRGAAAAPRPVALSHANLVANAVQMRHWIPSLRYGQEVFLSAVPLLHSYGLSAAMSLPITVGATLVLLPTLDAQQVAYHVATHRVTVLPGVPSLFAGLNQLPNLRNYGLANVKACISSAAPLPVEVQESFERLTQSHLIEGYGLTEAAGLTHADPLLGQRKAGSVGVPLPNTDAKVVDPTTGQEVPAGQVGELWVKGPQVTAAPGRLVEGWLPTGDLALADADGFFQIIGRVADAIPVDGHTVYPRDVEEVLYEHNRVMEAAVVGQEDGRGRRQLVAFVVPRPGAEITADELIAWCRRRLEEHAVPAAVHVRPSLPKSLLGVVDKAALQAAARTA